MTEQRFALTWTDYRSSLVSAFESLRADEELVDVTLGCQGRRFGAHKVLLSACSPYFRALLRGMHPGQHPVIMLHGSEANAPDLEAILEFVYSGEVSVEESRLNSFLMSARALQIIGLTEGCGARAAHLPTAPTATAVAVAAAPPGSVPVVVATGGGVARVEMPGRKRKTDGKGKGKKAKKIKQQQQEAATAAAAAAAQAVPQAQFLVEGTYGDEEVNFAPAVPQHLIDGSGGETSQHCYTGTMT